MDPTRTQPAVRRVGGGGTRNLPPASLGRVGLGFGWCSGRFGLLRESPDPTNVAGIFKKFAGICKNPVDLHQKSPKSAWISSNLVGSHQIWSRSCLDLLECRRISPNLVWNSLHIARFVYNVGRVGWLGFWRRKPTTRPAGVGSWAQKPVTEPSEWSVRAGCSGWSGSGLGWTPLTLTLPLPLSLSLLPKYGGE